MPFATRPFTRFWFVVFLLAGVLLTGNPLVADDQATAIKRLGILPGTFDPIHTGHLQLAQLACDQLSLDRLLFIPNAVNPRKPGMSSLPWRIILLKKALRDLQDPRLALLPSNLIERASTAGSLENAPQRLVDAAMSAYPQAGVFHILGSDSLEKILSNNGMPHPTDRRKIVVQPRGGEPPLDQRVVGPFLKSGVLQILAPTSLPMSSTAVRQAIQGGDLEFVRRNLPPGVARAVIMDGAFGLGEQPFWLDTIVRAAHTFPSQPASAAKRDILLLPLSTPAATETVEFLNEDPPVSIRDIDFSQPHTIGDLREYLKDRIPIPVVQMLKRSDITFEFFQGSRSGVMSYLGSLATSAVELRLKRESVTSGFFLTRTRNGIWKLIAGGDIYGAARLLQTQAFLAAALHLAGKSPTSYRVLRETRWQDTTAASYRKALADVPKGIHTAAIIGYLGGLSDGFAERNGCLAATRSRYAVSYGRLAATWAEQQKRRHGASWKPLWWTETFNTHPDLPHAQLGYYNRHREPHSLLITRNVYGDQLTVLLEILAREKGIKRFFLIGNAGSLRDELPVGALARPTTASLQLGRQQPLQNIWQREPPAWLRHRAPATATVYSVFSPLQETVPFMAEVASSGADLIDVEMGYLPELQQRLHRAGVPFDCSMVILVSDQPGRDITLSRLQETERRLVTSRRETLDLIVHELDIQAPIPNYDPRQFPPPGLSSTQIQP